LDANGLHFDGDRHAFVLTLRPNFGRDSGVILLRMIRVGLLVVLVLVPTPKVVNLAARRPLGALSGANRDR
jgi:hypothetical protein